MMRILYIAICWFAVFGMAAVPVHADREPSGRPASLKVFPASGVELAWSGRGDTRGATPICVSTPSGDFDIVLSTSSGLGLTGAGAIAYEVTLESEAIPASGTLSGATPTLRLSGRVDPETDCKAGPNARLVIRMPQQSALSAVSGSYSDQLLVNVETR